MKRILMAVVVAAVGVGLACGDAKLRSIKEPRGSATPPPGASSSVAPNSSQGAGLTADLRVMGANNPGYNWVMAKVTAVTLEANGAQLPVQLGSEDLDLSNTRQAWLAGRFTIPAGVEKVIATLYLDQYGAFVKGKQSGWVDFRGSPIRVELNTADLQRNHHAVLQMDLAKMLMETGRAEERIAVRSLMVRY